MSGGAEDGKACGWEFCFLLTLIFFRDTPGFLFYPSSVQISCRFSEPPFWCFGEVGGFNVL